MTRPTPYAKRPNFDPWVVVPQVTIPSGGSATQIPPPPTQFVFLAAEPAPTSFARLRGMGSAGGRTYVAIVSSRWFRRILASIFIIAGVAFVLTAAATVALLAGAFFGVADAQIALDEETSGGPISSVIQALAGLVAGVLIVRGIFVLRRSRVRAYRAFELAILVDLLLAQPFAFLDVGFGAAVDVFIDLALLATLRYLQAQEHRLLASRAPAPELARRAI